MINLETQVIGLLIIAVFVAAIARRFRVPYTVAMVLTGLVVGLIPLPPDVSAVQLEPHLILVTFLPGLLFEAAYHLNFQELRQNMKAIVLLAVPGVLLSMGIIGLALNLLLHLPLAEALLFGVLISATDPIAVVAIFKELGVERRLNVLVEGESLFNDGAAIVIFSILVGVATGDQAFNLTQALTDFFVTVAGGAALGLVAGLIIGQLMQRTDDHLLDIALTTICAYGTYLFAEDVLHGAVSPVIAVVVAAIYVGNFGSRGGYSATSQVTIISFWEFVAFLINSAVFLLIGLTISPQVLVDNALPIVIAIVTILVARALVVFPLRALASRYIRPIPASWGTVLVWGGLRGAVSIALALSLPLALANHEVLKVMAFGYVLFSLIVQGLTMRPMLRLLGLTRVSEGRKELERHRGHMSMGHAAINALEKLHAEHLISRQLTGTLTQVFDEQINYESQQMRDLLTNAPELAESGVRLVQQEIVAEQKRALTRLLQRGALSEETYQELSEDLDDRVADLYRDEHKLPSILMRSAEAYLPERPDQPGRTEGEHLEKPNIPPFMKVTPDFPAGLSSEGDHADEDE